MRNASSSLPSRRTARQANRRLRRRPALLAAGVTLGLLATAGITTTAPVSLGEASGITPSFALASFSAPAESAIAAGAVDEVSASDEALAAAENAIAAVSTVTADISAAGLDIGVADTTVDTTELEAAVTKLERAQALPVNAASFADAVSELVTSVNEQVAGLRGKLDAAIALKKEQEAAAERARLEAEAAAAAAAQKAAAEKAAASASKPAAPKPVYATGGAVGGTSPADAQATARAMLGRYGWGDDQFGCLVSLWQKESGWNYQAYNRSSGAYGIPQALPGSKMGSAGADWQTNPATQIAWGLGYISGRYGSPCGAWGHSQSTGWY
jgi:hypothetical protein